MVELSKLRNMSIQKIKLTGILIASHILIFLIAFFTDSLTVLTWLSLIQFVITCVVVGRNNGKTAFLPIAFIVISYVFNFSGLVLGEIIGYRTGYLFYLQFSKNIVKEAVLYYFAITACIALGACLSNYKSSIRIRLRTYNEEKLKKVAKVFLLIGIIPHLLLIVMLLKARISGGYEATYDINRQGIGFLSVFFYYGALYLLYTANEKKEIYKLFIFIIPIEIVSMLSGRRYEAISFLLSLFIVYLYKFDKLRWKHIIRGMLLCIVGILCINFLGAIRNGDFGNVSDTSRFDTNNALYGFLIEMGNTIRTLLLTIKYVPSPVPYGNGKSFYEFIPRIIPGINGLLRDEYNFTKLLPENYNIGGSYIAELYYNFKWFGLIPAFIIGKILMFFDSNIRLKKNYNSIIAICLLFPTIEYIRDIFYTYRYGVYFVFITFLFMICKFSFFKCRIFTLKKKNN